jgi:hypothetical protein
MSLKCFVFSQISLRKIVLESEAFRNRENLRTTFGGFPAFLGIAQKVPKPGFRNKSENEFFVTPAKAGIQHF